jgi:hypothetical protein
VAVASFHVPIHRITEAFAGFFGCHFPLRILPFKFIYQDYATIFPIKVPTSFIELISFKNNSFLEAKSSKRRYDSINLLGKVFF